MKPLVFMLAISLSGVAFAAAPSDAALRELLVVTDAKGLLDGAMAQMDAVIQQSIQKGLGDTEVTPEVQRSLDAMRGEIVAMMRQQMRWELLEPQYMDIYRQSFSQDEVDGMLRFYKSEPGRAVIAKMPLVMQHTMQMVQQMMADTMPKVREITQRTMAEIKAQDPAN